MFSLIRSSKLTSLKRSYQTRSIMINNVVFDETKILSVTLRPSYFWIMNPYILDIKYFEPYKIISQIPVGSGIMYHEETFPHTHYLIKYTNKTDLINDVTHFMDSPFCEVINKLDE